MEARHKEILRVKHVFLVENLNLRHDMFLAHLVKENLLSNNDVERLQVSSAFL